MRPRPCSPGGYERRSIAHFAGRQRSPLRKSFMPSRRQTRHFGPRSLATLDPPPLSGTDAVVRLRRDVLDAEDLEPGGLERADRRLAPGARALDEDLDLLQAVLHALARARVGGDLSGERRRLAGALEPGRAGGLPRDHVPLLVGQVVDLLVRREAELGSDLARRRLADAVDVGQPDLEPLLVGQVDSGDARQCLALPLLVARVGADDHGRAVPLDHATALAHG